MEEGFLFCRIALQGGDITLGYEQLPADVVAHLTDAPRTRFDFAIVAASIAVNSIIGQLRIKCALLHHWRDDIGQRNITRNRLAQAARVVQQVAFLRPVCASDCGWLFLAHKSPQSQLLSSL